jgi:uncharacterized membrane protein YgcG
VEDVQAYWIVSNPDTATADERVLAGEIQHFKLNVDRTAKRGLPTLYPVRANLDRTTKLLRNMSLMAQVQATFALIKKYKGYNPAAIQAASAADVDYTVTGPTQVRNIRQYLPGTVLDAPDGVEYDFPGGTVNAGAFVQVLQAELRAIASALVMPEFMLSSDASNANYSSTMVAESPAVKNFGGLQDYYKRKFGDGRYTPKETRNIPSLWRVIRNAVRAGRLPRAALYLVKLQLEAPSLIVRDKLQEAQRKQILKMNRILSPQTWSMQDDLNYEQEQQNFEEDDERSGGRANPLPLPGQDDGSGQLRMPTPESLREAKDASGHDHAADGRFGKGGGTSGGGGSSKTPPAASKASAWAKAGDKLKGAGKAAVNKGKAWVTSKYNDLEKDFGPKGAKAILGASVLLMAAPVPGSSLAPIALAKGYLAVKKRFAKAKEATEPKKKNGDLVKALRSFIADFHESMGEKPPKISDAKLKKVLAEQE